ncbi:DNA base-flipping protein [Paraliobacillus ryukyuensis]|uniref:Methylated-DNA-protein-cysteine methyltransferase-like protein n=1 Tax=Paraliobacillus ryukyuensis TaxID=200904 RepID=A0A366E962_9BACI|nr:MGMT family protein [Paraliobacillus ryukyuensis]RBO98289.1 methylated-DNA-protein-cysteine methyltransferase-like protein [Paraliobacillus ryukyuensis]
MQQFSINVVQIISGIPVGRVMTYGQIAKVAGKARGARQVARLLHTLSEKYQLPWHRVINSKGEISLKGEGAVTQKQLLEKEGVIVNHANKISLKQYGYIPDQEFM